jgi:hypothetical protein
LQSIQTEPEEDNRDTDEGSYLSRGTNDVVCIGEKSPDYPRKRFDEKQKEAIEIEERKQDRHGSLTKTRNEAYRVEKTVV